MKTLKECHEVIQRHIGQAPNVVKPPSGPAAKLADCLNAAHLTDWEGEFLEGVTDALSFGWSLTPNQQDTLDKIWRERT
jgi:hypothetical protein